jgi:hypothetical protein
VARVAAFIPDLLFGSNVVGALQAAGHEVQLVSDPATAERPEVLIVDLTTDPTQRLNQVRDTNAKTLAFYSHVEHEVRSLAEAAGIDLVVPRSRMAREGPALVARLSASDQ